MQKALILINPVSGRKTAQHVLLQTIKTLADGGYVSTVMVSSGRGDICSFAKEYGGEYDLLTVLGGDGTLHEAVHGLLLSGAKVPVGYIPCGSTNDFAISHKMSTNSLEAAKAIVATKGRVYDIGRFNDDVFTYLAAFGAFTWMAYTTDQEAKNVLGYGAYILDGAAAGLNRLKPIPMKITADGEVFEGEFLYGTVSNSYSVGGVFEFPKETVDVCDGMFEVFLIRTPENIQELQSTVSAILSGDYDNTNIVFRKAKDIYISNPTQCEWALDGESSGPFGDAHIQAVPGFLCLRGQD